MKSTNANVHKTVICNKIKNCHVNEIITKFRNHMSIVSNYDTFNTCLFEYHLYLVTDANSLGYSHIHFKRFL